MLTIICSTDQIIFGLKIIFNFKNNNYSEQLNSTFFIFNSSSYNINNHLLQIIFNDLYIFWIDKESLIKAMGLTICTPNEFVPSSFSDWVHFFFVLISTLVFILKKRLCSVSSWCCGRGYSDIWNMVQILARFFFSFF
jgi:hypothetical protein